MKKNYLIETSETVKIGLLGIHAPYNPTKNIDSYYKEFINLIESNNLKISPENQIFIKLREINPTYFLGKGNLEKIKEFCTKNNLEELIISEPLTAQQERSLSEYLECKVFDRTNLILEIFEKSAHTAEGKTQVEIAILQHKKTRLAGKGVHMSQQTGARGKIGGAGETAKEKETRVINSRINKLKKNLKKIQTARATQRSNRLHNNVPQICLIGYTNAGKSTILNLLTKSNVIAENKLFSTLDTTTRELYINGIKKGVLSDSVGFIQQIPHHLIEAFKSTLQELQFADLLLHVVDISNPNWESQIEVVNKILQELEIKKNTIYIFNKADKIHVNEMREKIQTYQPHVFTCAHSKEETKNLLDLLAIWEIDKINTLTCTCT